MSNANIEKLLAAQKVDRERLQLIQNLEKSKVKVELDKANKTLASSRVTLTQLENDAKDLQDNYQKFAKIINDTLVQVEKARSCNDTDVEHYDDFLSKLTKLEGQMADIERRIVQKTNTYKVLFNEVAKSSAIKKKYTEMFEEAKKDAAPKIQALEKQFNDMVKGIDEKLLAKYRAIRVNTGNSVKDVVVPLTADYCPSCSTFVPGAMVNKIKTDGWVICDNSNCGRIIYQA